MEYSRPAQESSLRRKPVSTRPESYDAIDVEQVPLSSLRQHQRKESDKSQSVAANEGDLNPLIQTQDDPAWFQNSMKDERSASAKPAPVDSEANDAFPGLGTPKSAGGGYRYEKLSPSNHKPSVTEVTHDPSSPKSNLPRGLGPNQGHPKLQPWSSTLFAWLPELIWCLISIASVVGLAILLNQFHEKRLPEWPLGLTLNTVVALLATFARAAFIVPVSESLSQLKWLWFRKERPLRDFQDFDAATRGPWGSLMLMKTTKGWSPSLISTVVFITAILTSTLTQSTVTYPTRLAPIASRPVLPRAVKFYTNTANLLYDPTSDLKHDTSIYTGLSYNYDTEFPFEPPRCPTTECRWETFSTLGICAKTWNITNLLNVTYGKGKESKMLKLASLPNGAYANLSMPNMGMVSLSSGMKSLYVEPEDSTTDAVSQFQIIYSLYGGGIGAMEANFYFCVQRYNVSVHENIVTRELIDATADAEYDLFPMPNHPAPVNLTGLKVPGEPGTKYPYGGKGMSALQSSLASTPNGSYSQLSGSALERGRAPSRYFSMISDAYKKANGSAESVVEGAIWNITNNIARSLTNSLSDDLTNVTGEALITETYVHVRWEWLAFISSQIALSILLLAIAIIQGRKAGLGVVKSSTLPAFFAVNTQDRLLLENGVSDKYRQEEAQGILKNGSGIGWKFGLTERGWVLNRS
ncbi:uncharacterized protein CTRU02_208213 [Colletotrichum truncatum]|uniref:Uncharacterized protein n=1 Tax=Colletotrichum truncatum TaxID=5467 RepID=A0ACC3YVP4_COLTU|nr:uncharacterized protein CTRU02_07607 [Colletotrichum truncatum]KAF6791267.1 hypothetical protein CTRU02_07607 [Colletotrichum truncatum]